MLVGIPKEIKNHEYRVGMSPASARELIKHGHQVMVEVNAGVGISAADSEYLAIGATVVDSAEEVFAKADMIIKVKEPQAVERAMLREGQLLYTYLHLAPDPEQTRDLVESGATCVAYETVTSPHGGLPLLAPMSKVAGRMSIQAGAYCLEKSHGGLGMLLGGVPGVDPAKVVVLGSGVVGTHATHIAVGMGADVWVIDNNADAIERHWAQFGRGTNTVFSTADAVERHVLEADLVIGGVLIPTRVVVVKPPGLPPTPNQPTWLTMWCTTALPTCRAVCHVPQPTHSTMSPCRMPSRWLTREQNRRCSMMSIFAMASTYTREKSPTVKWRKTSATNM